MKHWIFFLLISLSVSAQSGFDRGELLFKNGNYVQAQPVLEAYLKSHPEHLKTLEYLGDIRGHAKQWEQALVYYDKLRKLKPKCADYHYKCGGVLGMIAKESNKFRALTMISDVRSAFEKAIELDPKHIDARWALIELYLQLPGVVGGSESKANEYASQLQQLSPVDGYLAKGHIAEYFKRYLVAEQHYKKAIAVGRSKTTYDKLANLYRNKLKQPEKAKALMEQYNELKSGKA